MEVLRLNELAARAGAERRSFRERSAPSSRDLLQLSPNLCTIPGNTIIGALFSIAIDCVVLLRRLQLSFGEVLRAAMAHSRSREGCISEGAPLKQFKQHSG